MSRSQGDYEWFAVQRAANRSIRESFTCRAASMNSHALIDELKTLLEPGKVLTDAASLDTYGKDWTKQYAPAPSAIAFPKTT